MRGQHKETPIMSALTITKLAYRIYGVLFLLLGTVGLLFGGLLIYSSAFGLPNHLPDWTIVRALASMDLKAEPYLGLLGVFLSVAAAIPIVLGVFAYLRQLWAMIVGTLLWLVFYFPGPALFFTMKSRPGVFEIAVTFVVVLLTIAAIAWRSRPARMIPSNG
jgi:hypothetical protein